jgi:hypothetical protein
VIITKDNNGNPIGFIDTLVSNERVVTINQAGEVTTVTTRDRATGQVKTETFFGTLPFLRKDRGLFADCAGITIRA